MKSLHGWPAHVERSVGAHLRRRQRLIRGLCLASISATPRARFDAKEAPEGGFTVWIQTVVERLRAALLTAAPLAPSVVRRWATSIDVAVSAGIARTLGLLAATAPPTALVRQPSMSLLVAESAWVSATVGRVTALESDTIAKALTAAWAAADAGESPEAAARAVLDSAETRAVLTARDVIGVFAAAVAAIRAPQMGATRFRWRAHLDERTRPLHREIDGEVYNYPEGHPTEGLPSAPPMCRCWAEPIRGD